MHDPMVVAFEIPRPWPQRDRMHDAKPGRSRWRIRLHHTCGDHCGTNRAKHEARNVFPWWRRSSYSAFWVLAGRGWYWPSLVTVWHVEPGGRDSGEVCKWQDRWRWHVHHWRIQVRPVQAMRRWLFERCIDCGRRYPYGYAPISDSWNEPRGKWWRVQRRNYHWECHGLKTSRRVVAQTEDVLRLVIAELRLRTDETEHEIVDRLSRWDNHIWDFHQRRRLQSALGYERSTDEDMALTKKEATR